MRKLIIFTFIVLLSNIAIAQYDNSLSGVPLKERITIGGGVGLGFGSDQDFISVAPMIGYRVTERFLAGSGFAYRYTKFKLIEPALKLTDYGVNPFLRYTVFNNVFIQTEFEYLNFEFPIVKNAELTTTRKNNTAFFAGGGFLQPIGDRASFFVMALYNFSYTEPKVGEYSPYYSPLVLRAGINVGF
jgi:hypothetical protein